MRTGVVYLWRKRTEHPIARDIHAQLDGGSVQAQTKGPRDLRAETPVDSELAIIRTAIQKHRKAGDTYASIIAKCTASWVEEFKQERLKEPPLTDTALAEIVDLLLPKSSNVARLLRKKPTTAP